MNPELRELLGKAAYAQSSSSEQSSWESAGEQIREEYRKIAETVAMEVVTVILPTVQHLTFFLTGKQWQEVVPPTQGHLDIRSKG